MLDPSAPDVTDPMIIAMFDPSAAGVTKQMMIDFMQIYHPFVKIDSSAKASEIAVLVRKAQPKCRSLSFHFISTYVV